MTTHHRKRTLSAVLAATALTAAALTLTAPTASATIAPVPPQTPICWTGVLTGCTIVSGEVVDLTSGATGANGGRVRPGDILEQRFTLANDTTQTLTGLDFYDWVKPISCGDEACQYATLAGHWAYAPYAIIPDSMRVGANGYAYPGISGGKLDEDGQPSGPQPIAAQLKDLPPSASVDVYIQYEVPLNAPHGLHMPSLTSVTHASGFFGTEAGPGSASYRAAVVDADVVSITGPEAGGVAPTRPGFSGTGEPGASVVVALTKDPGVPEARGVVPGAELCSTTVTGAGNWSCESTLELPVGQTDTTITATALDRYTSTHPHTFTVVPTAGVPLLTPTAAASGAGAALLLGAGTLLRRRTRTASTSI